MFSPFLECILTVPGLFAHVCFLENYIDGKEFTKPIECEGKDMVTPIGKDYLTDT